MQPNLAAAASRCPVMSRASETARKILISDAQVRSFRRGGSIFHHGAEAESGFVLMSGWVKIARTQPCGATTVLTLHAPGETFGFSDSIRSLPRGASAEAATNCTVLSVSCRSIRSAMRSDPDFGGLILSQSYRQNDDLVHQLEALKIFSSVQRLACFLLLHAKPRNGRFLVQLPFEKHLVAHYLGIQPESLSRNLAKLKKHGVRSVADGIEIADPEALKSLVGDGVGMPDHLSAAPRADARRTMAQNVAGRAAAPSDGAHHRAVLARTG